MFLYHFHVGLLLEGHILLLHTHGLMALISSSALSFQWHSWSIVAQKDSWNPKSSWFLERSCLYSSWYSEKVENLGQGSENYFTDRKTWFACCTPCQFSLSSFWSCWMKGNCLFGGYVCLFLLFLWILFPFGYTAI